MAWRSRHPPPGPSAHNSASPIGSSNSRVPMTIWRPPCPPTTGRGPTTTAPRASCRPRAPHPCGCPLPRAMSPCGPCRSSPPCCRWLSRARQRSSSTATTSFCSRHSPPSRWWRTICPASGVGRSRAAQSWPSTASTRRQSRGKPRLPSCGNAPSCCAAPPTPPSWPRSRPGRYPGCGSGAAPTPTTCASGSAPRRRPRVSPSTTRSSWSTAAP